MQSPWAIYERLWVLHKRQRVEISPEAMTCHSYLSQSSQKREKKGVDDFNLAAVTINNSAHE